MLFLSAAVSFATDWHYVVLPVEFSDVHITDAQKNIYNKVEEAKEYLNSQFSPAHSFAFTILPTVRLPYDMAHYGSNTSSLRDTGLAEAIKTACSTSGADFSAYDADADGTIDNICLIPAGGSEADGDGADCFWPQQGFLSELDVALTLSGKTADSFTICPELASTRVFCHEICHVFGLSDMYDADGRLSGGTAKGLWGSLSIMDNGDNLPNFCAVELEHLGLGTCIKGTGGYYKLHPLSWVREYIRIESDNQDEYFLLECRDANGWDASVGGSGLVIYHIDKSLSDAWYSDLYRRNLSAHERWEYNQVNCRPEHPCARVIEAVPGTDNISKVFFPQKGHTAFGSETDPAYRYWSGVTSETAICNIEHHDDGTVSFDLLVPITLSDTHVFQDAVIAEWSLDNSLKLKECDAICSSGTLNVGSQRVYPDENGNCSVTFEGLEPQSDYQITVRAICTDGSSFSRNLQFKTKVRTQNSHPYIYFNTIRRNDDGSFPAGSRFPLRIYNAENVEAVKWYFNGIRIYPGHDGHWVMESSGALKAEVWYSDGSCEIITKQLKVK